MCIRVEISEQHIPVLTAVAVQALDLIRQDNVTHQRLEDLIRQDPGLTSRLLAIANSPFYASKMQARTISEAARRLGLRQMQNVIVAAAAGELFNQDDLLQQRMWSHSVLTAQIAQLLCEWLRLDHADEAYVAGLLHDIGMVIIYRQHPDIYAAMIDRTATEGRTLLDLEQEEFRFFTHCSIGGLVARKWRLSDTVAEAARFHHDLLRIVPKDLTNAPVACAVAIANRVAHLIGQEEPGFGPADADAPVDTIPDLTRYACAEPIRFPAGQSEAFVNMARERFCKPAA